MHIAYRAGLWKCVQVSFLYIRFRNKFDFSTSSLILSTQSTNHRIVFSVWLTTFCLIASQMLLSRNCSLMMNGERIPSKSNLAETNDRTILWVFLPELLAQFRERQWNYLCLHSSSVQGLRMIVVKSGKFFKLWLGCLHLWFVTWLLRHSLSTSLN